MADNDGADFPNADPRIRTKFDGADFWGSTFIIILKNVLFKQFRRFRYLKSNSIISSRDTAR